MGADRRLVTYDEFVPYYELLAGESDRVSIQRVGRSTLGRDMVLVLISSPENLARVDRYRDMMETARRCTECRECVAKCPYDLAIPEMIKESVAFYEEFARGG